MKKATTKATAKTPASKASAKKTSAADRAPAKKTPVVAQEQTKPAPVKKLKLPAKEKEQVRRDLMLLRDNFSSQIHSLEDDSLKRQDEVNTVEDGTDAFERQLSLNLASSEQDLLFDVENALRRLDEDTYGICESCTSRIEAPRLKAMPFVRLCIKCQSEMEKTTPRFRSMAENNGL